MGLFSPIPVPITSSARVEALVAVQEPLSGARSEDDQLDFPNGCSNFTRPLKSPAARVVPFSLAPQVSAVTGDVNPSSRCVE